MSYTVRRTNGTTLVEVADQTINSADTPLALVGRGAVNYGQAFAENFVHLLENFANPTAPVRPIVGMQWYDSAQHVLRVYDGQRWNIAGGSSGSGNTQNTPSGLTIGGTVASGNRLAGATGAVISFGSAATTVAVILSEGKIISISSSEDIPLSALPPQITIDNNVYVVASRFPNGIKAGTTLATDNAGYEFAGTATSALYADLAERYAASEPLEAGDVVELGGVAEVQKANTLVSPTAFGVVSTNPALKMNSAAGTDETHPYIALAGRVPCKVMGTVKKGQRLVASDTPGVAVAVDGVPATAFARALADKNDTGVGLVEVVLGGVK